MTTATATKSAPQALEESPGGDALVEMALREILNPRSRGQVFLRHPRRWLRTVRSLHCLGGVSSGNAVRVFCDGDALLESLWAEMDAAVESVWIETYCLGCDRVGRRIVEGLVRARERGCEVILIFDCLGSRPMDDALFATLREKGGRVIPFHPLRFWALPKLLTRDHRKISIIDRRIAYCGGMNLSEEYAGPRHGTGRFLDCQLRLEGPCVADLERVFRDSLREAAGERDRQANDAPPVARASPKSEGPRNLTNTPAHSDTGVLVQVLGSNARRNVRSIQRALRCAVRRATGRCWLTTPYFVPPRRLRRAMSHAAKRGVDVRLLTAGLNDVPIARSAGRYVYDRLLRDGVRIYEMFDLTLHTKRGTVDGLLGTIGSFNLDTWSDRRNLEVTATVIDPDLVRQLDEQFEVDLRSAREIKVDSLRREPWHRRALQWAAYQLLRI